MARSLKKRISKMQTDSKFLFRKNLWVLLSALVVLSCLFAAFYIVVFLWDHPVSEYSDNSLFYMAQTDDGHMLDFNDTLDEILRPRVPGTEGNKKVRQYLTTSLRDLGWHVEEDSFEDRTPLGMKPFTNVIATLDPSACRYLVLACHHDSKLSREDSFLGATDSAVPCAMLLHLAKALKEPLQESPLKGNISLQLLFLDGEEAFQQWSDKDSLYGSRHLAEMWNKTPVTTTGNSKTCRRNGEAMVSRLDQIDVFVLLDLIGSANPRFYSYFSNTFSLYSRLHLIEKKLNDMRMVESPAPESRTRYFANKSSFSFVEDDHIPFMQKGVPIIHLIPVPFPSVWHKDSDNRANLHHPTINNLNKIFRIFVSEYLHLNPELYVRRKL